MRETERVNDAYQTRWESNFEDAKQSMYEQTGCIEREFEHLLPQDTDNVVCEWNDIEFVAKKKEELRELVGCFIYLDEFDNTEIEYNFSDLYDEYLLNAWSVTL
jgi:hypothetical protein